MSLEHRQQSIESERLSNQELRTLLEAVGERELGGSDDATLLAVSEATGCDPAELAAVLSSLRRQATEKQFGQRVGDLEERAENTEFRVDALESKVDPEALARRRNQIGPYGMEVFRPASLKPELRMALAMAVAFLLAILLAYFAKG